MRPQHVIRESQLVKLKAIMSVSPLMWKGWKGWRKSGRMGFGTEADKDTRVDV